MDDVDTTVNDVMMLRPYVLGDEPRVYRHLRICDNSISSSMALMYIISFTVVLVYDMMIEGIRPYTLYHAGHTRANARGISGSVRAY